MQNGRKAVELNPHLARARQSLGAVLTQRGEYGEALEQLEEARRLDPGSPEVLRWLGRLHLARSRFEEAERAFRDGLQLAPDDWLLHLNLGTLQWRQARYDEAEVSFERAIEITPDSHIGYRNLSAVHQKQGRMDDAIAILQKGLEHRPFASVYGNLGTLYYFQGLYPKAVSALEEAVRLRPNHYRGWADLRDAYRRIRGREEDAAAAFLRAVQLTRNALSDKPDDPDLNSQLALYLALEGDRAAALEQIERTLELGDRSPGVLRRLLLAYEACGRREAALETLQSALEAGFPLDELEREPELTELRKDLGYHRIVSRFQADKEVARPPRP